VTVTAKCNRQIQLRYSVTVTPKCNRQTYISWWYSVTVTAKCNRQTDRYSEGRV